MTNSWHDKFIHQLLKNVTPPNKYINDTVITEGFAVQLYNYFSRRRIFRSTEICFIIWKNHHNIERGSSLFYNASAKQKVMKEDRYVVEILLE